MDRTIALLTPQRSGSHYIKSLLQTSKNVVVTGKEQADHVIAKYTGLLRLPTHEDHQVFTLPRNLSILRNEDYFHSYYINQELQKWFSNDPNYKLNQNVFLLHMPTAIAYFDILARHIYYDHIILSVRNPYAVTASIKKVRPNTRLTEAAFHAGCLLKLFLKSDTYIDSGSIIKFRYEDMCEKPLEIQKRIKDQIPELDIDIDKPVATLSPCTTEDNTKEKKVSNFNKSTIDTLDELSKEIVTSVLKSDFTQEMNTLGYQFI